MDTLAQPDGVSKTTNCEVCGAGHLVTVLDLGSHPLCDDLIPVGNRRRPLQYPISIGYCRVCRTAHQRYPVPKRILFPATYHYRARHTGDVLKGMDDLVQSCEAHLGDLHGFRVLDIGCNDGSLLSKFAQRGAVTFGIEPTRAALEAQANGHVVYQDFLTPQLAERFLSEHPQPQLITFTNVFAHIEDLSSLIESTKALMSPDTLLVIENHYLGSVLDRCQFDTFYHEHPRTYSVTSFKYIADALHSSVLKCEFPSRYGGNIRVMMQRAGLADAKSDLEQLLRSEGTFEFQFEAMARRIPVWQREKRAELLDLCSRYGRLPAKAFPGRSAILVKLLGLDETMVSAVYEKPGSAKVGHYLPGTGIPIRSDEYFASEATVDRPVLNFAWHISEEIRTYMRNRGFVGPIIDIFHPDELRVIS